MYFTQFALFLQRIWLYAKYIFDMKRKLLGLLVLIAGIVGVVYLVNNCEGKKDGDAHILPSDSTTVATTKPVVRIYVENSGSMNGYVTTDSQFKNALGRLITKANRTYPNTQLRFVNQDICYSPLCDNLDDFVLNLNTATMKVGNTSSTDINKIFEMILDRTQGDTISVLVSDCMYDVENVGSKLSAAANSTMGKFMGAISRAHDAKEEFGVIIMQCMSEFNGNYYEGNTAIPCNGLRPYYIIAMGGLKQLMHFNEQMELENTSTGLPGLTHKYMLSSGGTWTLDNTTARVYIRDFTNAKKIQLEDNRLDIRKITTDHDKPNLTFAVALGVSHLFVDRAYLLDKENYAVEPAQFAIAEICDSVSFAEYNVFARPYAIQLTTEGQNFVPQVTIRLLNKIPSWVKACNYNKQTGVLPPENQSYAIYEMIEGIYNAFYNSIEGKNKDLFRLSFHIKGYE